MQRSIEVRFFCACTLLAWLAFGCEPTADQAPVERAKEVQDQVVNDGLAPADERPRQPRTLRELIAQRETLDRTIWRPEVLAQRYGIVFVRLWDELRAASDRYDVLKRFPFERLLLGTPRQPQERAHGIYVTRCEEPSKEFSPADWRQLLDTFRGYGLEVVETEWHHVKFDPGAPPGAGTPPGGRPARSEFEMVVHVANAQRRIVVRGRLAVEWSNARDERGQPIPSTIDASSIELVDRRGEAPFKERFTVDLVREDPKAPPRGHPLIVYDIDGDGLSEIILAGWNRLYRNRGGGKFEWEPFCRFPRRIAQAGILADFTGDGHADFICADRDRRLYIYEADSSGRLSTRSRPCWSGKLDHPSVFSAGDYDRDGDLDVWLAQYRSAYTDGSMPTPIYDANDGHPAFLLRNDGQANFTDVTEEAGLAAKRFRRTYSSSFLDLDDDHDLDLLVVSDFSGIDVYLGDGKGRFTDVTESLVDERHTAGMAHTIADFDLDGALDFYVIGMSSATVARLDGLGLGRKDLPDPQRMRGALAYGNRMYLSRSVPVGTTRFAAPSFKASVAHTGWSWGTTSLDFDNDGDPDLYVASGHISGRTALDYCTDFWRHDVYLGSAEPDPDLEAYFRWALGALSRGEISWNGFEHDALLMNDGGKDFFEVGFPMGVAFEFDARGVVSDDLDGDGRLDLIVTEQRTAQLRTERQVLHVIQNKLPATGHWIGIRLREEGGGFSPIGAKVTVKSDRGRQVGQIVTGDSFLSQHSTTLHFGLGEIDRVEWVEVRWVNGTVKRFPNPRIDRYHSVKGRREG